MKIKPLNIKFESTDDFFERVGKSLKKRRKSVAPKDTLLFADVLSYQRFMTEQKLLILVMINTHKPNSLYQLAKMVDRNLANVKRDCDALEKGGFIVYEDVKGKPQSKAPRLSFDYNAIVVYLPNAKYSHLLDDFAA